MALIHGQTVANVLTPLLVDSTGRPLIALDAGTNVIGKVDVNSMPVTHVINDAGTANIGKVDINSIPTVNVLGKSNDILLAYKDIYNEKKGSDNLPAGASQYNYATVPAGEMYHITNLSMYYNGVVAGVYANIGIYSGSDSFLIKTVSPFLSNVIQQFMVSLWLKPGYYLFFVVAGATLNDDCWMMANGHKMSL